VGCGTDPGKTTVIPNGIDGEAFHPLDRDAARRTLGLDSAARIVLTVCSLVELKGVHLLIEAAALLRARQAGACRILVVGKGPERERLQRQIDQSGLSDIVTLIGAVPNRELVTWYNAADLFFLGSSREGWPNVVCEALACGTPVVATNVSGIPEIIDHEGLGLLVERSPQAFADGLLQALQRPWDREFIAGRGRRRDWEAVAHEVLGVFSRAVDR
jgi:glycosyltransferase involved in cell wall biosynthesis